MPMKLIGSSTSPYVRKVRIVMAEKKLDYNFVLEDVWSEQSRISEANPLGKVPCPIKAGDRQSVGEGKRVGLGGARDV